MNVLFLTIVEMDSISDHGIYPDLLRCFQSHGHQVYTVSPYEKRLQKATELKDDHGAKMLHVQIGNITKCGIIEKGISTIQIESRFCAAIKKYFSDVKFDLVMYSTPPITFAKVIEYVKKRDNARTYLLLKDIFPQNAVDLGMMSTTGIKGMLYRYFRSKEKKLYALSDTIGCMSQANVDYIIAHNPEVNPSIVEVCPNSIEVIDKSVDAETRCNIRQKYGIPQDKKVFVYGGNLGKPQGVDFLIGCLKGQQDNQEAYFLIVGDGTEYAKLETFTKECPQQNVKLMKRLPKDDYDTMVAACDVGMIFLDYRFTIPNFPSRLLSYMQAKLPVLACTDPNTDIGKVITEGGFGWWCESDSNDGFASVVREIMNADFLPFKEIGFQYLLNHYTAESSYQKIAGYFERIEVK